VSLKTILCGASTNDSDESEEEEAACSSHNFILLISPVLMDLKQCLTRILMPTGGECFMLYIIS